MPSPAELDLLCPVCLEWLSGAMETNCAHAFCSKCLLGVLESAAVDCSVPPTAWQFNKTPQCPTCRCKSNARLASTHAGCPVKLSIVCRRTPIVTARSADIVRRVVHAARSLNAKCATQKTRGELVRPSQAVATEATDSAFIEAEIQTALFRLADGSGSLQWGFGAMATWKYQPRLLCGCIGARTLAFAVCVISVGVNAALYRIALTAISSPSMVDLSCKYSTAWVAASNIFSVFTFAVGIIATTCGKAPLVAGWLLYVMADTAFSIIPAFSKLLLHMVCDALPEFVCTISPLDTVQGKENGGFEHGPGFTATVLTLVVNALYNSVCTFIAWRYFSCFRPAPTANLGPRSRSGQHVD